MKRTLAKGAVVALAAAAIGSTAPAAAQEEGASSRVFVSTTLNSTIHVFEAESLVELQPPILSKGAGPVRLWVQEEFSPQAEGVQFVTKPYLFAANHGAVGSSVGVFDLSGDLVVELPLSPFPTGEIGAVAVTAGTVRAAGAENLRFPMVFISNVTQALGGCGLPNGSVTAYDGSLLDRGLLVYADTLEVTSPQPWGVAVNESDGLVYAALNCGNRLDTLSVHAQPEVAGDPTALGEGFVFRLEHQGSRPLDRGSDGTLYDQERARSYTVNIGGGTLTVYDAASPEPLTVVPLKRENGNSASPIDLNFADSRSGSDWIVTANGADDSVSILDRDVIEACIAEGKADCPEAEVHRAPTGVPGGSPEGIDYDPATNRIFVVNKPIFGSSLSVIQLTESPEGAVASEPIAEIPLGAAGTVAPVPAVIAFDVVVQER